MAKREKWECVYPELSDKNGKTTIVAYRLGERYQVSTIHFGGLGRGEVKEFKTIAELRRAWRSRH
jgi:hypothetical protein